MSSIIQKGFNIFVRTLAKPVIEWVVKHKKDDLLGHAKFGYLGRSLSFIGQKFNYYSVRLNRKVSGISNVSEIKPLTNEKALEKGAEFFTEISVYSILIFVPIIEWRRQAKVSYLKEKKDKESFTELYNKVFALREEEKLLEFQLKSIKEEMKKIDDEYTKKMIKMRSYEV